MQSQRDTSPASKPKPVKPKRLRRVIQVLFAALVTVVVAVIAFFHTAAGRDIVRSRIEQRIASRVNGSFRLERLDYVLFGNVSLHGVRIADASDKPVITLRELHVDPSWSDLIRGSIVVDELRVDGLALGIEKYEDGTSNLQGLFKKSEPPPPDAKPSDRRLQLRSVAIADVDVTVARPDGSRILVRDIGIDASVDATPGTKTAEVEMPRVTADFELARPAESVTISLSKLQTGLHLSLDQGAGSVRLARTQGQIAYEREGDRREIDLDFEGFELELEDGDLEATVRPLIAGAVLLQGLTVHGAAKEGSLAGPQQAELVGLDIDAKKLNTLLRRDLLASDVAIRTKLSGPPNALDTLATIGFGKAGKLTLSGKLDVAKLDHPGYDLTARISNLDTSKLLVEGATKAPPVTVEHAELTVKGTGASRTKVDAQIGLQAGPIVVGRVQIDDFRLKARYTKGKLIIDELSIDSLGQHAELDGEITLASKHIETELRLEGDVGKALERLREAGVPVKTRLPPGAVRLDEGTLAVRVEGALDGDLHSSVNVDRLPLAGGIVSVDTHADLRRRKPGGEGKAVEVMSVDSKVRFYGIRIERLLALRGKRLRGYRGTVSGRIATKGKPDDLLVHFGLVTRARATDRRGDKAPSVVLSLNGTASRTLVRARVKADRQHGTTRESVLHGDVRLPLRLDAEKKGLHPYRRIHANLVLDSPIEDLLSIANQDVLEKRLQDRPLPRGHVNLDVNLGGSLASPEGSVVLNAKAGLIPGSDQRVLVDARIKPRDRHSVLTTSTDVWLDAGEAPSVTSAATVDLSGSPFLPGARSVAWEAKVDVRRHELGSLPVTTARLRDLDGSFNAHAALSGSRSDVLGEVTLNVHDLRREGEMGPLSAAATVSIHEDRTSVDLGVDLPSGRFLTADGTVGLAGEGLIPAVRGGAHRAAPLDLEIRVPRTRLKQLAVIRPGLAEYPGELSGRLAVDGRVSEPTASGGLRVDRFETLAGTPGELSLRLEAAADRIEAQLGAGLPEDGAAPVRVTLGLLRDALAGYRRGETPLPLHVAADAHKVDLAKVVPAKSPESKALEVTGTLNWDMRGVIALKKGDRGTGIDRGQMDGALTVTDGGMRIPGTKRRYRDIACRLVAGGDALRLEELSARESDMANDNRRIALSGQLSWSDLKPTAAQLSLKSSEWLVFGGGPVGPPDAPRGTLSIDAKVNADLTKPIRVVDVHIESLDFLVPQRFPKAHQPEVMSLGDVIYLDEVDTPPGTLPVPEREEAREVEPAPEAEPEADGETATATAPAKGYDIHVRIPNRSHLLKDPMDLQVRGEIDVTIRPGRKTRVEGELRPEGGYLMLGGRNHDFHHGKIVFNEEHPAGYMDFSFAYPVADPSLRDFSLHSQGDTVRIHMEGPVTAYETTLAGVGSPGTLFDLLAIHNTGRARYTSEPDMPATVAVQYPQHWNLLMLGFMRVNLPHLLFLDRIGAWADPYDSRNAYGRVQHMEGEAYTNDGAARVRAVVRPRQTGRSQAELQYDWLLVHDERKALGVGFRGGSRLGGGPGITLDWSSDD